MWTSLPTRRAPFRSPTSTSRCRSRVRWSLLFERARRPCISCTSRRMRRFPPLNRYRVSAWPPKSSARASRRPWRARGSPPRSARRSNGFSLPAWACTTPACCRAIGCWWKSLPNRGFCPSFAAPTRWAWASTSPSIRWCSPRSPSSTGTACGGCAPANSIRSRDGREGRASTPRAW